MTDERSKRENERDPEPLGDWPEGYPSDPLDELLTNAFAKEMADAADVDISGQVMQRLQRRLRVRAITLGLGAFAGLCTAIGLALPNVSVLLERLAALDPLAPTTTAVWPVIIIAALAPWLLWVVDDRV